MDSKVRRVFVIRSDEIPKQRPLMLLTVESYLLEIVNKNKKVIEVIKPRKITIWKVRK